MSTTSVVKDKFLHIIQQAPVGIAIFSGPQFLFQVANEAYLRIIDKIGAEILGKSLFAVLPEVKDAVEPLMTRVLTTGEPCNGLEFPVVLHRHGKTALSYFNFVYEAFREENGEISGVVVVASDVTDQVRAKHQLTESENQFRNLVMQSPIPMAIFRGKDLVIEMANHRMFSQIWQRSESAVMGKKILDVFPELKDQEYAGLMELVYQSGETYHSPESVVFVEGDGGLRRLYIDITYAPLRETDGSISGLMVTIKDITERVQARQKVEFAEERWRLAIEATNLGTWELDLSSRKVIYDKRFAEIFSRNASESGQMDHADLRAQVHPDDLHRIVDASFDKAIDTGVYSYEARLLRPDQSICWIRTQGKVLYDARRRPLRLIGTVSDSTEERLRQQELLESEQKFRLLAESMPQLVWTAEADGTISYRNSALISYSGLLPHQGRKGGWEAIIHPDDRDSSLFLWKQSLSNGKEFFAEHRLRRFDGTYHWMQTRTTPQKDATGQIQMWVGTSTDIQAQKSFTEELEKQVQNRTRELEEKNIALNKSNAELKSFAYVSSHDLQEPLRKIQTFASWIMEKEMGQLTEKGKDHFVRIQKAAGRMQALIEDLLTYSRTNNNEGIFELTDLAGLAAEVKQEMKERIEEKGATVSIQVSAKAHLIPFQFRQLLQNLISNSLKFALPGTPPLISIRGQVIRGSSMPAFLAPDKIYCHLQISDNGIGFDPQYKDRIFEVFQRLHGREQYQGTGIGLAIVKKIVENHAGIINASSTPGQGARFDVYFPV
ncbi:MAG: PAS domain-containing protein [Candidatus Pseudobacter hemicellulosilyticus]|uniref:histidine kinase n=1 Tax=Candidatus Pseudobacter hemicellulosilyticus TaxID=3121375 RepID=A0AAJ5WQR3_9BACT|nr:MAG: PAS domain-containing protein [Pseudobacter sp.]